jgi:hypothetical protein
MTSEDIVTDPAPKRGRPFKPGNPGRKPGSKNRMTALAQAMVEDDGREIIQKAIEMAKAGNERLLRFFIERMLPKQRLIEIPLPEITFASDAADALSVIVAAVSDGHISPSEAAALAAMVEAHTRIINLAEIEIRLAAIEAKLKENDDETRIATANFSGREPPASRT